MQSDEQITRRPARELVLKDAGSGGGRVAVLGRVVSLDSKNLSAIIADGAAHARLLFSSRAHLGLLREGGLCRAIGKGFFNNNELTINVEAVHPMDGLDLALWEKVRAVEAGNRGKGDD